MTISIADLRGSFRIRTRSSSSAAYLQHTGSSWPTIRRLGGKGLTERCVGFRELRYGEVRRMHLPRRYDGRRSRRGMNQMTACEEEPKIVC
jgi:hypothetical protein